MSPQRDSSGSSATKTVALLLFFIVFLFTAAMVVLAYLPPEKRPIQLPFELPFGRKAVSPAIVDTDTAPIKPTPVDFTGAQFVSADSVPAPAEGSFRNMVAVHGNLALVGNPSNAFLYAFENGKWAPQEKLFPNDNAPGVEAVALGEGVAVVEANEQLFIFNQPNGSWRFLTMLAPDPSDAKLEIGAPIVTTKQIFVPVPSRNTVRVFEVQKGTGKKEDKWQQTATLSAPDAADQAFGFALDAVDDQVAVSTLCNGASGQCAGAVYLFERDNKGNWLKTEQFTAPSLQADTLFGSAVAMADDTVFVGAPCDSTTFPCEGAVYPIKKIGNSWTRLPQLRSTHPKEGARFGTRIDAGQNGVVVGTGKQGTVSFFSFENNAWQPKQILARDGASQEGAKKEEVVVITDFVSLSDGGILQGSHLRTLHTSEGRQIQAWCMLNQNGCSGAVAAAADEDTSEPKITPMTENIYEPLSLSCDGQTALDCAKAHCEEVGKRKCAPERIVQQLAAEAYLTTHGCPASNIERTDNSYGCRVTAEQKESTCLPAVTPLTTGAFTQKETEEVLLSVNDVCHRVHVHRVDVQSRSYGYVMGWREGAFKSTRNLSYGESRYSDRLEVPGRLPSLDGDSINVLGSLVGENGKTQLVYCVSGENQGNIEWECADSTQNEDGIYFPLWDNFGAESNKRKQLGCSLAGSKQKKIDTDDYPDLVVTVKCTKSVRISKKKRARKAETYDIEILFNGTQFKLAEPLPDPIAFRASQAD